MRVLVAYVLVVMMVNIAVGFLDEAATTKPPTTTTPTTNAHTNAPTTNAPTTNTATTSDPYCGIANLTHALPAGHTACLPEHPEHRVALSNAEKTTLLNLHNGHRRDVDPKATNMFELMWDDDLSMLAQRWAEQCKSGHDDRTLRKIPGKFDSIGQNAASASGSHIDVTPRFTSWYNERKHYSYMKYASTTPSTGHYTQLIWAETLRVGCGRAKCPGHYPIRLICNYAPGGNYHGKYPYINGTASGSACGTEDDKLCVCNDTIVAKDANKANLCYNNGKLQPDCTCDCSHAHGYKGADCNSCVDSGHIAGFPSSYTCARAKAAGRCKYSNVKAACCQSCQTS